MDGGLIVTIRFRIPLEREGAMKTGPICPLRLGTLDSLDYWTDPVLMSSVRPLSAQEIQLTAEQSRLSQVGVDLKDARVKSRASLSLR